MEVNYLNNTTEVKDENRQFNNNSNLTYVNAANKIEKLDSYTVQAIIYKAEMYILLKYPQLAEINKNENTNENIDDNSKFFVIKTRNEEDAHKSIKYNIWASTKYGNKVLNEAFKKLKSVYLFFTSQNSGRFLGIAKMQSELNYSKSFPFWTKDNKHMGLFAIEWIFIKDLPYRKFKEINIKMTDGVVRPVSFSRDTQEVPFEEGKTMLEIYEKHYNTNTILEHFEYYDIRQENYEKMMANQYNNQIY